MTGRAFRFIEMRREFTSARSNEILSAGTTPVGVDPRSVAGGFLVFAIFLYVFLNIFLKLVLSALGPFLGPNLGLCWELFGAFFALKLRSDLKVVFSSIFH